ncbi:MAG: hypothetical protein EOO43_23950 [Flavobacterium sp.]|nr:MAG: hypothetical protein EOO43_23950 [Flavobacterium sp.]
MTAILSVYLGNAYGVSVAAQQSAVTMIKGVTYDRWLYFFNECLPTDQQILYKLMLHNPSNRWMGLFNSDLIDKLLIDITKRDVVNLLKFTKDKKQEKLNRIASEMYKKLGYANS